MATRAATSGDAARHSGRDYSRPAWWQRRPDRMWLLALTPVLLFLAVFFLYPLTMLFRQSFYTDGFTLAFYREIFSGLTYLHLIWNTIWLAVQVTLGALLIGYPIAVWLAGLRGGWLAVGLALVMMPLWTSVLVRNYAWIILLRQGGPVSQMLQALGFGTPQLLYRPATVVAGMIYTLLPYMIFTLTNAVRGIDRRTVSAARGLGASPARAFLTVYLPLSLPAVSAASLLVFILAIGFFITPAMLGGGHVEMIAPEIDNQMNQLTNWGFGAALSVVLFVIVAGVAVIGIGLFDMDAFGPRREPDGGSAAEDRMAPDFDTDAAALMTPVAAVTQGRIYTRPPGAPGHAVLSGFSLVVLALLLLPALVTAGSSFTATNYIAFPPQGWSLRWYHAVLADPAWIDAAVLSFEAAGLSAATAVGLGMLAALCLVRGRFAGGRAVHVLLLAPMIVPSIVMAVGLYFLYARLHLLGTIWSLVLAYAVQTIPVVTLVVASALRRIDLPLERSAMIMGARPARAFLSATFPTIWPAVAAAGLFAFIHAFDDVVIAEFIAGTANETLPKKMWVSLVYSIDPGISVVSTIFVLVSVVLLMAVAGLQTVGRRQVGSVPRGA